MSEAQIWGEPASTPRRWGVRETAAAIGVAAAIAGFGGAAIYAATDSGSAVMVGGPHQAFGPGGPGGQGGPGGPGGPGGQPSNAPLHGEFVAADGNGTYTAHLTQSGHVTAISPTSITVRSEDDFSQTYLVPANANVSSITVDDQVMIEAVRNGQTATVNRITPNR